ncbi:shwachman-bodian-diamond syndrome (SBDS) protein [Methanobrevibacter cuticularis]|uniref:Shwachman-bodian-diamond syndrome (SBDS) protein n=1 Tax=Methanobrevibacter cuticularis TaxID=47311 RepID=A0A166CTH6_9EURY|nr:ribosome assembly factor SBDS [Methanobrevibacter cuticularis]KZX14848.1 shwachman-bodian-diamond syndrome (SBDS) protein [Methanobrevibacter cuticularis]
MVNIDDAVIARLESHGERFEILVDPDLASDFKNPEKEGLAIEDVLAVEEIFKDAKKGDKASEDSMNKVFENIDTLEVATAIINKGHIQLTAQQKRDMQEEKRLMVINKIARESINPQTGLPHPVKRIENAMEETKVKIDPFKSVDEQVQTTLKAIKIKIPIRFEKVKIAVRLPGNVAGNAFSHISKFGTILNEEWQQDGSWVAIVEIPGGIQDKFNLKMGELSGGESETKLIK